MKVIGIGHKARQGKNTLAKYLVIEAGKQSLYAKQYGFADALRAACRVLGMQDKNPHMLQHFGTDVMRQVRQDIWGEILQYTLLEDNPDLAIITDVRFPNEADRLRHQFDATLIRLDRYGALGDRIIAQDRDPNHISETALDDYHWDFIHSTSKLIDLEQVAIYHILNSVL